MIFAYSWLDQYKIWGVRTELFGTFETPVPTGYEPAACRTAAIVAEDRITEIMAEDRITEIMAENRTMEITC